MLVQEIEDYLRKDIKRSIRNDVYPLVASSTVPRDGGLFGAPLLMFSRIDFLGYLYKGERSSKSAVTFIRDYFGKIDIRYAEVGGLLYHIYRHGTIHEYEPKKVKLADGTQMAWYVYKGGSKELHLSAYVEGSVLWLRLRLDSLFEDLNSAIDLYIEGLKKDEKLRQRFKKARNEILQPESEAEVRKKGREYILQSDFDFVARSVAKSSSAPS